MGFGDRVDTNLAIKTAARTPDAATLATNVQFSAYSYAAARIYRERPRLRLDYLVKTKEPQLTRTELTRTAEDNVRLFVLAAEILAAIEKQSFFRNPGWQCRGCEFRYVCPVWKA